jgi:hypothetical protein
MGVIGLGVQRARRRDYPGVRLCGGGAFWMDEFSLMGVRLGKVRWWTMEAALTSPHGATVDPDYLPR